MAWRKSPETLVAAFDAAFPPDPRAERRKMFGYPCGFVGGNMFTGLHQESLIVRLAEKDRRELIGKGGAVFEPMAGRPMKEYVAVPAAVVADEKALRRWMARAFEYAASLPAKAPKAKRRKKNNT